MSGPRSPRTRPGRAAPTSSRSSAVCGQGVSLDRAQQEMTTIMRRLEAQYPESNASWGAEVVALREQMIGEIRPALLVFMGAVGLVLLVACANVANLMLARAAGRRREVTIRSALGASRARLAGELLLESMLLALLGGALGLLLALWGVEGLRSLGPDTLPRVNEIGLDLRVLGFALALSLVTGLLFGLAPIWRMAGRDLHEGLARGQPGRGRRRRASSAPARRWCWAKWRWPSCCWPARRSCSGASSGCSGWIPASQPTGCSRRESRCRASRTPRRSGGSRSARSCWRAPRPSRACGPRRWSPTRRWATRLPSGASRSRVARRRRPTRCRTRRCSRPAPRTSRRCAFPWCAGGSSTRPTGSAAPTWR